MKVTVRQLTDWLYETYDISFMPKHFFINLDKVFKGTYKGLKKPVPVEDLLDMWQRKLPYLTKVYIQNKNKGKDMTGMARINYDLAILLSRYDSYCEWKDSQLDEVSIQTDSPKVNYSNIETKSHAKDSIESILDDIWGGDET